MQLPTLLVESLKSGKITISQKNVSQIEINVQNKKIDVNAKNKEFVKEVFAATIGEGPRKSGIRERIQKSVKGIIAARDTRPLIKDLVEDFCKEGVTVTISYRGDKVATIGSQANSKLTRLVTGTRGIEINSPRKLAELGISTIE